MSDEAESAGTDEQFPTTIRVRVGKLPGVISEVALDGERTVKAALQAAGLISGAGEYEVRLNDRRADLGEEVRENDNIFLLKQVTGG